MLAKATRIDDFSCCMRIVICGDLRQTRKEAERSSLGYRMRKIGPGTASYFDRLLNLGVRWGARAADKDFHTTTSRTVSEARQSE